MATNLNLKGKAEHTYDAIVVGSGISGGWAAKELCEKGLKTLVLERGRRAKEAIVARMKRASDEGDLPANVDPEALTNYLYAMLQGMSVQAGAGATREELGATIETVMAMWPSR